MSRTARIIAACESGTRNPDGTAIIGTHDWTARNPYSSASGAFQFINSTWQDVSTRLNVNTKEAALAPPHVQIAAFRDLHRRKGLTPWNASRSCWQPML
jgi:muramidase (phage lysozyme)